VFEAWQLNARESARRESEKLAVVSRVVRFDPARSQPLMCFCDSNLTVRIPHSTPQP
jgi:hypothetical protein